jgi:hypothetical protein
MQKMHRPQGSLCWPLHLAGVREKDMMSPRDSMGHLFAVSNISFGLSGLICLSRFAALELLRLAHQLVMPSLNLWRFVSVSTVWIVVCFGFRDQGAVPWG